jgi:hypothetical protein
MEVLVYNLIFLWFTDSVHLLWCLLGNSILNLDFIQTQTGQDAVRLSFLFFRHRTSISDVYKTVTWTMCMARPDVYTDDKQTSLFESFLGVYYYALPSQHLVSEWRCKSIYYQSCSLGLHTTINTTSMIVSTCHTVKLLTRAGVIVGWFYVMALQATVELTGAVLFLWICMLLLLTQPKEISCYRTTGTGNIY